MIINTCPHCGHILECGGLTDGIATCNNCRQLFDNSLKNRLLSASWLVRKHNCHSLEQLMSYTKMPEHEAILVYSFVEDNCYSHEAFRKALVGLGLLENKKKLVD